MKYKNMKKIIGYLLIIILISCPIIISTDINHTNEAGDHEESEKYIKEYHGRFHRLPINSEKLRAVEQFPLITTYSDDDYPFNDIGNQIRPAICQSERDVFIIWCYDTYYRNITGCSTYDDGITWGNLYIWSRNSSYVTPDYWEGERCFFTDLVNPRTIDGYINLYCYDNITDETTLYGYRFNVGDAGYFGMKDASIACDNSQNWWEFGVGAYIMNYSDDEGYTDLPIIFYMFPNSEDWAGIGYWEGIQNCAHCENDIDRITHLHYAVYDYYNISSGHWEILIYINDFEEIMDEDLWTGYILAEQGDLERPVVAAYNDHLIILAESETNGNKDIICYYSPSSIDNLQQQLLFNTSDQEGCPNIFHVENTTFVASFVRNGNIYTTWTMDGGAHWTPPYQVNENYELATNTYRSSCLWYPFIVWEEQHQDIDLILKKITMPPDSPSIQGSNTGIIGEPFEITITAKHPDGLNLSYLIDWGDGTNQTWTDSTPSGEPVTVAHTYDSNQSYQIRGKARNEQGVESHWTSLAVTISKNKMKVNPFMSYFENHPIVFQILQKIQERVYRII
jgi:hypothetical protein